MTTVDSTSPHPLHALYLSQRHGEASTLPHRARLGRDGIIAGTPRTASHPAAATLLAGLGLTAAAVVARLLSKPLGGR